MARMALLSAEIDIRQGLNAVERFALKAADLSPYFNGPVDSFVRQFFSRQFASDGRAGGTPWAPLRPATVRMKQQFGPAKDGADAIGRNTLELMRSLTMRSHPRGVLRITPKTYERGTSLERARWMQEGFVQTRIFGNPRKFPRRVPARPLVPDTMPRPFITAIERGLVNFMVRGGFR